MNPRDRTPATEPRAVPSGRLGELESVIDRGLTTFVEVGNAIREIRDSKLYKESHETFEKYCRERWGWGRAHAYRQIEAADTVALVSPTGDIPNERIARELAPLAKKEPETAGQVLDELVAKHGDALTGSHTKKAVEDVLEATVIREQLPPKTRAAIEDVDPKTSSMPRSPAQMRHLKNITDKHGDERGEETVKKIGGGEFNTTYDAYPEVKQEATAREPTVGELMERAGVSMKDAPRRSEEEKALYPRWQDILKVGDPMTEKLAEVVPEAKQIGQLEADVQTAIERLTVLKSALGARRKNLLRVVGSEERG